MRTETHKIYRFAELSPKAKDRAKQDYAADEGYSWSDEAIGSLKKLAEHFSTKLSRYEIDWGNSSYSSAEFTDTLRGHGDCKLTGFCHDESAIDGLRIAFMRDGETDLTELMDAAFDTWLKAVQDDCEYQYSDEAFDETCEANDYEFYEDGELA